MARKDKQLALRLRREGKTYGEIQKLMGGIPKSTLSVWLKYLVLSDSARKKITQQTKVRSLAAILKHNKTQTVIAAINAVKVNVRIFQHLNEHEVIDFWSSQLGIPKANFQKTHLGISKSSQGKRPF